MGKKLTKNERNWILYDVGNSAFTLLIATILPIYFNYLAGNAGISSVDYLAYWGYAASVGTILVALAGPVLGTMADTKGFKKPIFTAAILTGVAGCALLGIAIFAVFLKSQIQFWILAVLVGMFQGGIQALSRSYFTKIIPAEKSGEYFGLMDICGKGASFMGTTIVSLVSQITGNINAGVGMIAVLFVAGIILFRKSVSLCNTEKGEEVYPAPEMPQRSSI